MVKSRVGVRSVSVLTTLMLSKPFGTNSLIQRIAKTALSIKEIKEKLARIKKTLPATLVGMCERYVDGTTVSDHWVCWTNWITSGSPNTRSDET